MSRDSTTTSVTGLITQWTQRALNFEPYTPSAAEAFRCCARELEAVLLHCQEERLSLAEASRIGGYSIDHLQRQVAAGKIANAGRRGSPSIRRADVPMKPGYSLPAGDQQHSLSSRRRMALAVITSEHEAG